MNRWRRNGSALLATAALGYLVAMVVTGALPVQRQLVPFEARGVLKLAPQRIRQVELNRGAKHITLVRRGEMAWATQDGTDVGAEAGKRISMAVQMMHTSGPTREMHSEELVGVDVSAFGLDPPQLVVRLYAEGTDPILTARFGAENPDGFLQYLRVDGDHHLYLISRFVAEEWLQAANGSLRQ